MFKQPTSAREELTKAIEADQQVLSFGLKKTKEARISWQGRIDGLKFALSIIDKWEARQPDKCKWCSEAESCPTHAIK